METLQNLLTIAIEVVAIAGFGGISLHAIWSSHCNWMKEYCPTVEPVVEPMVEPTIEPVVEPMVEPTIEPVVEPMVEPTIEPAIEPAIEQVVEPAVEPTIAEPAKPTFEEIDNTYKAPILRQLCEQYGIAWKDIRGKGRHMLKSAMIQALLSQGAF